ncbi:hypothetical protein F5613_001449 [Macellibacteroides fermentans]|uniref:Uncharacterized protein n=4 Tax=Macellibacteroides fermentans TaxID=879969 RepID=A0A8E2D3T6_9PORP|nr:hypothetical protein [Macellibacteroides fermentans]
MNTLVVGWTLPAVRARWGLTPVRIRSCWANNKKTPHFILQCGVLSIYTNSLKAAGSA